MKDAIRNERPPVLKLGVIDLYLTVEAQRAAPACKRLLPEILGLTLPVVTFTVRAAAESPMDDSGISAGAEGRLALFEASALRVPQAFALLRGSGVVGMFEMTYDAAFSSRKRTEKQSSLARLDISLTLREGCYQISCRADDMAFENPRTTVRWWPDHDAARAVDMDKVAVEFAKVNGFRYAD